MKNKFDLKLPWKSARFAAFDLETTGVNVEKDRIIEIGIIVFENEKIIDRYNQLINPEIHIPKEATAIHGIKNEDVADKPTFRELADELIDRLNAQILLAYNHNFDCSVFTNECKRIGREITLPPTLDPFPFVWEHFKNTGKIKNAKLTTIADFLSIPLHSAHRAEHDAEATGHVLLGLSNHIKLPTEIETFLHLQKALTQKVEAYFARFRRGKKKDNLRSFLTGSTIELGAAYIYGTETDPVRALFKMIPDVRDL